MQFTHPGPEPAEFETLVLPEAEGTYATVVVRNHRVVQVGGTAQRPVLVREWLDDEEFRAVTDSMLERLAEIEGISLCFEGEGFDPSSVMPGDEEALNRSAAWAAVLFVPPDAASEVRRIVAEVLAGHGLANCWVIGADPATGVVVRALHRTETVAWETV
jgi:hypothetical protein